MRQKRARKIAVLLSWTERPRHRVLCRADDSLTPKTLWELESCSCFWAPSKGLSSGLLEMVAEMFIMFGLYYLCKKNFKKEEESKKKSRKKETNTK